MTSMGQTMPVTELDTQPNAWNKNSKPKSTANPGTALWWGHEHFAPMLPVFMSVGCSIVRNVKVNNRFH